VRINFAFDALACDNIAFLRTIGVALAFVLFADSSFARVAFGTQIAAFTAVFGV
jgi:hypothetical protein